MRWTCVLLVLLVGGMWSGCSSKKWVHPTKKEEFLTYDWNQCERDWNNLITTNPGAASIHDSPTIERARIASCLQKKGWRQVEEE